MRSATPSLALCSLMISPALTLMLGPAVPAPVTRLPARAPRPLMLAPEHIDAVTTLLAKSEADELLDDALSALPLAFTGAVVGAFFTQYAKNLQPLQFEWSDLPEDITLAPPDLPFLREGPTIELKRPKAPGIPGLPDFDPPDIPSEYAQYIPFLICPVFAGFFVLLGNSGILGTGAPAGSESACLEPPALIAHGSAHPGSRTDASSRPTLTGAGLFFKAMLDLWNVFANLALKGALLKYW